MQVCTQKFPLCFFFSLLDEVATCKLEPCSVGLHDIHITFDGVGRSYDELFEYKADPRVAKIEPKKSFVRCVFI